MYIIKYNKHIILIFVDLLLLSIISYELKSSVVWGNLPNLNEYIFFLFITNFGILVASFSFSFVIKATLLFFKTIVILVFLYPLGTHPSLWFLCFLILSFDAVLLLESYWFTQLFFYVLISLFYKLLPHRAWGITMYMQPFSFFIILTLCNIIFLKIFRHIQLQLQSTNVLEKKIKHQLHVIDQVYQLNSQFQEYALNIEYRSAEAERKRLTRDLHDIMGYTLVNLRVMLEVALDLAGQSNQKLSILLQEAINHSRDTLQSVRKDLRNLRHIEERTESWINRMYKVTSTFSHATGIQVFLSFGNVTILNCPKIKNAVYQFVQESLTNAYKHGKATKILVDLRIDGLAPNDFLIVRVIDNGIGAKNIEDGIGFMGIKERIELLEGETEYKNNVNGFEIWIRIPILSLRKDV